MDIEGVVKQEIASEDSEAELEVSHHVVPATCVSVAMWVWQYLCNCARCVVVVVESSHIKEVSHKTDQACMGLEVHAWCHTKD